MDEMQRVLDDLKALISKPSVLVSPEPGETILLYVTVTTQAISAALVVEQEEKLSGTTSPQVEPPSGHSTSWGSIYPMCPKRRSSPRP
jgi:hypothetical protein